MFQKILIANRGEIACRIIKTASMMGIKTVAIYHVVDQKSLYVKQADEAICLAGEDPASAYLDGKAILKIAKETGAEAIHPGYGFLSENAEFAKACEKEGIAFIGPSAENIIQMGEKGTARQLMVKAGLPVLPGYDEETQSADHFKAIAKDICYPVLLKASAGGGGKGMRVVSSEAEMEEALKIVKREALKLFKNDHIILEKFLQKPRHIEIQIFADGKGGAVYLFERECSLQRRHQKIIEEAPAANFSEDLRKTMGEKSVEAALAIGYKGAGTFEFLLDEDGQFYFMEMNTRLQVEHPVTELITGVDLVEWQLRIAYGEKLPASQKDLKIKGHAIEARLCAEDVQNNFLPAIGKITHLKWSEKTTRVETGIVAKDEITPFFDSMIAKLVIYGQDRKDAILKLEDVLSETRLVGLKTNLDFLGVLTRSQAFQKGGVYTKFVEDHYDMLCKDLSLDWEAAALALIGYDLKYHQRFQLDRSDPWQEIGGFLLNHSRDHELKFVFNDQEYEAVAKRKGDAWDIDFVDMQFKDISYRKGYGSSFLVIHGQKHYEMDIINEGHLVHIYGGGRHYLFAVIDPLIVSEEIMESDGHLMAPMPGKVIEVLAQEGMKVKKGASLIIIEAMKMEHSLIAPSDGVVKECFFKVGDQVTEGVTLIDFESAG